jgi:hypothetical protein
MSAGNRQRSKSSNKIAEAYRTITAKTSNSDSSNLGSIFPLVQLHFLSRGQVVDKVPERLLHESLGVEDVRLSTTEAGDQLQEQHNAHTARRWHKRRRDRCW